MTGSSEMITERPARSGRVMGLDFGSKTVGVAVSDALLLTAQGVEIIRRQSENKLRRTLARITELAGQYEVMWDERLTTVAADRLMMETGIRRENRKEYVDEIAAMLILQGYLDRLSSGQPLPELDPDALLEAYRQRAAEASGDGSALDETEE